MDYKQTLEKAKLLPPDYREDFEARVVEVMEAIISVLPEQESVEINSKYQQTKFVGLDEKVKDFLVFKVEEKTPQQIKSREAYLKKKKKEAQGNLERIEKSFDYFNEKIEEYKTGYYCEKETRKRFKGMPEVMIELSINEHRNTLKQLERDLNFALKEERKWKKYD